MANIKCWTCQGFGVTTFASLRSTVRNGKVSNNGKRKPCDAYSKWHASNYVQSWVYLLCLVKKLQSHDCTMQSSVSFLNNKRKTHWPQIFWGCDSKMPLRLFNTWCLLKWWNICIISGSSFWLGWCCLSISLSRSLLLITWSDTKPS